MFKITFKKQVGFGQAIRALERTKGTLKQEFMALGEQAEKVMQAKIQEKKVRPQAGEPTSLENAIKVEYFDFGEDFGWGVGNIEVLNKEAPYWGAVNYGSAHMVGKRLPKGIFEPGMAKPNSESQRAGRWKKGMSKDGGSYSPIVTKPIPAMKYIERTIVWVGRQFKKFGTDLQRKI